MANAVQKSPWKIPFDVSGSGPFVVKILLSDLLFEKPDPNDATTWTPYTTGGFKLPKDILLYDPNLYSSSGDLVPTILKSERQKKGFFLTKVSYDERANRTWTADGRYKNLEAGDPDSAGYYTYDSEAALVPSDEIDYRSREKTFNIYLPPDGSQYKIDEDYYTQSCTVGLEGSSLETTAFLVLANRDEALEATIPGSSLLPYTRIRANADPSLQEAYNVVRFFTGFGVGDQGENSVKSYQGTNLTAAETLDPTQNVLLQTVEIWLRCSYFADYVDPASFLQDLHSGANVQHKNLILGDGDFEAFSRETSASEIRPYLPTTVPREDEVSSTLITNSNASWFPIPPRTGEYDDPEEVAAHPLGWYDPRVVADNDNISSALPSSGNIYTSGRVFSPTIDELWKYIKKLTSGRAEDDNIFAGPKASVGHKHHNDEDTRIATEPPFSLPDSKEGDPLSKDGTKYVNVGEGIMYVMNANLRFIADKITAGIESNEYAPFLERSSDPGDQDDRARLDVGIIQTNDDWGLRANPLSLRELEALIKNQQYDLEVAFNFIAHNKVSTGNTDTEETNTHGTLYQLHRDFVPDLDQRDPNSKWVDSQDSLVPTDNENTYGDELPGSGNYDRLSHQDRQDIYLSAEGKWRYLFDHVRIPVLDEKY